MLLLLRAVKIAVTAIIRERFILLSHENLKYYIFLQLLRNILSTLSFLAFSFSFRKAILILINYKVNVGLISKPVLCTILTHIFNFSPDIIWILVLQINRRWNQSNFTQHTIQNHQSLFVVLVVKNPSTSWYVHTYCLLL